jgi:hypothetical protein
VLGDSRSGWPDSSGMSGFGQVELAVDMVSLPPARRLGTEWAEGSSFLPRRSTIPGTGPTGLPLRPVPPAEPPDQILPEQASHLKFSISR